MTERKWKKKSVEEGDIALLEHQTSKVVLKNTSFTPGIGMHHSLPIRLWKMLVSTKKKSWIGQVVHAKHWLYICEHWLSRSRKYPLPGPTNPILSRFKEDWNAFSWLDCKTVGFVSKLVKKSVKRGARVLRARSFRGVWVPSLALCFQPRSRPFVRLLVRTWTRNNTDCFAVYLMMVCSQLYYHWTFITWSLF